jgi:hypothetical protein
LKLAEDSEAFVQRKKVKLSERKPRARDIFYKEYLTGTGSLESLTYQLLNNLLMLWI